MIRIHGNVIISTVPLPYKGYHNEKNVSKRILWFLRNYESSIRIGKTNMKITKTLYRWGSFY